LIGWLELHARIAVQAFLVIGGFLAARSLSPDGVARPQNALHTKVGRRYLKLVPPFLVATLLAVGASAWAGNWMSHASVSGVPTLAQLLAHALLLHSILGYESISAGAWYVAIDFQLYALLASLVWICGMAGRDQARAWLVPAIVLAGVCASLFWFNRDARLDIWAFYFFGSYGMGALAWWASERQRRAARQMLLAAIVLPATCALLLDFRSRIALALFIACMLAWCARRQQPWRDALPPVFQWPGRIAYSVFLIHFPVCLVVNAAFTRYAPLTPAWQGLGMLVAWAGSVLAGAVFFQFVEAPLGRLRFRARRMSAP
jgi:peptidoglycan/LPS O-acetylase OafA/YrhL